MKNNLTMLLKLMQENPDLRVIPMVDSEIVGDEEYSSYVGKWGNCYIDEIYKGEDRYYKRSLEIEDLVDCIYDDNYTEWTEKQMEADEMEETAMRLVNSYNWEKVIIVNIDSL